MIATRLALEHDPQKRIPVLRMIVLWNIESARDLPPQRIST